MLQSFRTRRSLTGPAFPQPAFHTDPPVCEFGGNAPRQRIEDNLRKCNDAMGREFLRIERVHRDSIIIRRSATPVLGLTFVQYALSVKPSLNEAQEYCLEVNGVSRLMWRQGMNLYATAELADKLTLDAVKQA